MPTTLGLATRRRFPAFIIGGTIFTVIVIGTVTRWDSGAGGKAKPAPVAAGTTVSGPTTSHGAAPTGTYKIVFDGVGDGRYEVPDNRQAFKSNTTHATWHLEYTFGESSNGLPDPATAIVTGDGFYSVYYGTFGCHATAVKYAPNVSILKTVGSDGETFSLTPPLAGDLTSSAGCTPNDPNHVTGDPFYQAWNSVCGVPCPGDLGPDDLGQFIVAVFTIHRGQTGTVATPFSKKFHHKNLDPVYTLLGAEATHSWSGTITVIAQ